MSRTYLNSVRTKQFQVSFCPDLENPAYIKLRRLSKISNLAPLREAMETKDTEVKNSKLNAVEAQKIARGIFDKIQLKKKIRPPGTALLSDRLRISGENRSRIFVSAGVRQPMEEIYQSQNLKNRVITTLLDSRIHEPLDYHFLCSVLTNLEQATRSHTKCSSVQVLTPSAAKEAKRLEKFLEEKKKAQDPKNKKVTEKYQDEVKNKLKLINMIGGQVYRRIADRMKTKAPIVPPGSMAKK